MTRIIKAELMRLVRRRTVVLSLAAALVFAVVTTLTVFASAKAAGIANSRRGGTTLAQLAGSGGVAPGLAAGAPLTRLLGFVTLIAVVAPGLFGGMVFALVIRDPHR